MYKTLLLAICAVFLLSSATVVAPGVAYAKSDKNQAELKECKNIADPKARDECVKQAGKSSQKAVQEKTKNMKEKAKKK